jgi:Lon protease-like protein
MLPEPPPAESDRRKEVVPLFPLPDLILFPGVLLPLHVFEPRYRQMIEDLLDGNGNLVMGTVLEEQPDPTTKNPDVEPVAGMGQVENYQQMPDGRFLILLRGLSRVRIEEVPSDRLYRKVAVNPVEETEPESSEEETALREALMKAIDSRSEHDLELPDGLPVGQLADLLLILLKLPPKTLYRHYRNLDVGARAEAALNLHGEE